MFVFSIVGLVYAVGFHFPYEILPGQFANGNYSFNGSLGIGTSSPTNLLNVQGSSDTNLVKIEQLNTSTYGLLVRTAGTSNSQYALRTDSNGGTTVGLVATNAGNVGIGTSNPLGKLHIKSAGGTSGGIRIESSLDSSYTGIYKDDANGVYFYISNTAIQARLSNTGVWTNAPSFSWLKQNRSILSEKETLNILKTTNIEKYKMISEVEEYGENISRNYIGIILDEANPALVSKDINGSISGYSPMRTASVAFRGVQINMEVIQEQQEQIEDLKKRLEDLE